MEYDFVWTPKYRKKLIVENVEKRLKSLLKEKCKQLGIEIISLETMPDHVHIFLKATPVLTPNRIFAALKGYTSRVLRQEFAHLKSTLPGDIMEQKLFCIYARSCFKRD
jgi:putative transposase